MVTPLSLAITGTIFHYIYSLMKEYKLSKSLAVFTYVIISLLIAGCAWAVLMPLIPGMEDEIPFNVYVWLAPLLIAFIVLMIFGIVDTAKGKFVIDSDRVYSVSVFYNRELMHHEIKGFRSTDKHILIEPVDPAKKRIKVSTYISGTNEILQWLSDNYPDLDLQNMQEERTEILNDQQYGGTTEEREEQLKRAGKAAKIVNYAGGIIAAWVLFFPRPYNVATVVCMVFPIIGFGILKYFDGLIKIDARKGSAFPSIAIAMMGTTISVLLRGAVDYNIFDYTNLWLPVIAVTVLLIAVVLMGTRAFSLKNGKEVPAAIVYCFMLAGYSYGSVVVLNCSYDNGKPEVYTTKILNKRITTGKHTSRYFELTPWGLQKDTAEVTVHKSLYEQLEKGDSVNIYFMKGRFGISWFDVGD
ncbi:MAG: hypothetical protein H7257_11280 [Taibaiella sp.]|nr:hypothetical protein [Taibaiella sp.]